MILSSQPLVSVIMPFFNPKDDFFIEAIQSICSQTYPNWELLLVDDGSQPSSTKIAYEQAQLNSRIRYIEHAQHANLGISASRNLGISQSKGEIIGFLDSDDVWLPQKLERQLPPMLDQPTVIAMYANTLYWYSWNGCGNDRKYDFIPELGFEPNTTVSGMRLLAHYLDGSYAVPCICSLLVSKSALEKIQGFENEFVSFYEDQVVYSKLCLNGSILVLDTCLDWYRQHKEMSTAGHLRNLELFYRYKYLTWLSDYMHTHDIHDAVIQHVLRREIWRLEYPQWLASTHLGRAILRRLKKWLLKAEKITLLS